MILPPDIALRFVSHDGMPDPGWIELLSAEEQERLQQFTHEHRRRSFLMGRMAARGLLAEQLDLSPVQVPLRVAADGAVEVDGHPLSLSISHAWKHAVAAVAGRPVGVDLERIVPRRADLYRFMLHPDEVDLLDALPLDHDRTQVLLWTLKEATLKAMRTGFRVSPKKLRLAVDVAAGQARVCVEGGESWQLRFEERDGCYFAIAFAEW